ncbi:MAG: radical SAM family heme chaperone HemW [Bacteroidota bacterium]
MAGLYLHIPFCKQACYYCDFHFSTQLRHRAELTDAICEELKLQQGYLEGEALETVYLGGGTPSVLEEEELNHLFECIHQHYQVLAGAEITAEVNPDDLTNEKLNTLHRAGINRLSIGIQSFNDPVLTYFNRAHNATQSMAAYQAARLAGFTNISIDLIYGVPGTSLADWKRELDQALMLKPEHLSAYSLTIEENTVFGRWHAKKKLQAADEKLVADQLELLVDTLTHAGYEHYEVSNFARPGYYSRHNTSYWQQKKYLGVGPSAHSYNGHSRQFNVANNGLYTAALAQGRVPFEIETLTQADQVNEYLLTTLRTSWGCDIQQLRTSLGFTFSGKQQRYMETLVENGLAEKTNTHLRLTKKGKMLADKIASDLFVSGESSEIG